MADKVRAESAARLDVVHADCAGIDIGKKDHYVAVDPARFEEPVRSFGTFTDDLEAMAGWLRECGVRTVAMEATGVYWIPAFEVLEQAGFEVHLVNPRATKQVSGRKSDVLDCQWIRQLMSHGLLRGAFRVPDEVCALRSYLRQSDVMGVTGQRIVRAIVAGERDGAVLAGFRDGRCKADEATIAASLRGNWRAEHLFALELALERYDALQRQIAACEERIDAELDKLARSDTGDPPDGKRSRKGRDRALRRRLRQVLGVDLMAIPTIGPETALAFAAEVGVDLSRFPTAKHFCSWLALAPDTRISGGKRLPGGPGHRSNRLGQALRMAATTARRDKSAIGAAHRRRLARMDTAKAVKATAHQLARLIYAMLTKGEEYVARDLAAWETERRDRTIAHLQRQARRFELALVPADTRVPVAA